MEFELRDGRYVPVSGGGVAALGSRDERIQGIMLKLKARRGAFYPLPDFGSRLHSLRGMKPSGRTAAAKQFIHEALADEEGLEIKSVDCSPAGDESLAVRVGLSLGGEDSQLSFLV